MVKRTTKESDKLKELSGIASAGRNVSLGAMKMGEGSEEPPAAVSRTPVKARKRMGRPPLPEPAEQRTITFTVDLLDALEKFSAFSGKTQGFRRPSLSETVRAALRMWVEHDWSKDEKRNAWLNAPAVNGDAPEE